MKKKKQSKFGLWISRIIFVVALCVFVYSAIQIYDIWKVGNQVKQETNEVYKKLAPAEKGQEFAIFNPDWEWLKENNPDIMGFIVIPDTNVFYPMVYRANDNDYYLNRTAFLQSNILGAIFLDGYSTGDLQSPNTIIYGHNVSGQSSMFSDLSKFFDEEFAKEHPYVYIFTPEKNYRAEVVSAYRTTVEDSIYSYTYSTYHQINEYIAGAKQQSVVQFDKEHDEETNYITLSTCSFDYGFANSDTHRYLVHAAMVEWDGELEVPVKK